MGADYIITGALGHLAQNIIARLRPRGCRIVGIDRPEAVQGAETDFKLYGADVRDSQAIRGIFRAEAREYTVVIHTAALVHISDGENADVFAVNVGGTKNILDACVQARVRRLVYVGSVHAIPVSPGTRLVRECARFDPAAVTGVYAKSKAAACAAVLEAEAGGLDAVVVLPSGILGPGDRSGGNHLNRLIRDYIQGHIPVGVQGGFDLVDVRDAAQGIVLAADKGISGRSYILSGRWMSIRELFDCVQLACGGPRRPCVPIWAARLALPFIRRHAERQDAIPLFTAYSLDALRSNALYLHDRASRELGYAPHDLHAAVIDTARWYAKQEEKNTPLLRLPAGQTLQSNPG